MTDDLPPLSQGNRFQRAYARWAEPWYARMPADLRDEARAADRYLYSRRGLWIWSLVGLGLTVAPLALHAVGVPLSLAIGVGMIAFLGVPITMFGAWMRPAQFHGSGRRRRGLRLLALTGAGLLTGFVVGHLARHGDIAPEAFLDALRRGAPVLVATLAVVVGAVLASGWLGAELRLRRDARRLAHLRLVAERDAAARDAAEARLRRLQAQVQPHFLFNTLSTLQHWVDTRDPRAGPLLRELTGFLRRSTELLGGDAVRLADEAAAVGHYLAIQQARLGERLAFAVDVDPALGDRRLPPGVLLSWVENALEHGIEPALAGGRVTLRAGATAGGWMVELTDDGLGLAPGWREGVGLGNARQRLAHAFGDRARVAVGPAPGGGTRVALTVTEGAAAPAAAPAPATAAEPLR